jgi:hypothetical protein
LRSRLMLRMGFTSGDEFDLFDVTHKLEEQRASYQSSHTDD